MSNLCILRRENVTFALTLYFRHIEHQNLLDIIMSNDLPDDASWDDLMYRIYVRQSIEEGLKDSERGKVFSHEEIKEKYRLSK